MHVNAAEIKAMLFILTRQISYLRLQFNCFNMYDNIALISQAFDANVGNYMHFNIYILGFEHFPRLSQLTIHQISDLYNWLVPRKKNWKFFSTQKSCQKICLLKIVIRLSN